MNDEYEINNLINKYGKKVFNLAYRIIGNIDDAEDITQETFIIVHNKIDTFKGDSQIYTWIFKIALNKSLEHKNRLTKQKFDKIMSNIDKLENQIPDEISEWFYDPEKKYMADELMRLIRERCHHYLTFMLTDEQRTVYILKNIMDFSLKEISYILDVTENVVKSRLHRAKESLENHLKRNCQWYNENNKCKCKNRIGYAILRNPDILNQVKKNVNNEKYFIKTAEIINNIDNIDELYRKFPELEYKTQPLKKYLKKLQ